MFRVESLNSERAECATIQSKNAMCDEDSKHQFDNLNAIKNAIVKHLKCNLCNAKLLSNCNN